MPEESPARTRLLRKHPDNRVGLVPNTIYDIKGAPLGWEDMKPIRITSKISAYFERALIKEVRRFKLKDDISRNQYFMKLTDGTFVEVLY